jgi:hypothetical protein
VNERQAVGKSQLPFISSQTSAPLLPFTVIAVQLVDLAAALPVADHDERQSSMLIALSP